MELTQDEINCQNGFGKPITVHYEDNIAVITFRRGENRVNLDFLQRFNQALDEVERNKDCIAAITIGVGKFYCNGYDLEWKDKLNQRNPRLFEHFQVVNTGNLLHRLATFPIPLVAACYGHAFALGAFISLVHDQSVMRLDQGWWCFNEVHIGLRFKLSPLSPLYNAILNSRIPRGQVFHDAVILGKRFTGPEAQAAGIVHEAVPSDQLLPMAIKRAKLLGGIPRDNLRNMKIDMYPEIQNATKEAQNILAKL